MRETANAVLVDIEGEEHWLPLSQVERMGFHRDTGKGYVVISAWLAKKIGAGE
jgi:hypothetical protein